MLFLKPQTFGLGQTIWADKSWGIFKQFISTHFYQSTIISKKPKPLYPNIYLGLGFEFGLQRIRDSAIVCP